MYDVLGEDGYDDFWSLQGLVANVRWNEVPQSYYERPVKREMDAAVRHV